MECSSQPPRGHGLLPFPLFSSPKALFTFHSFDASVCTFLSTCHTQRSWGTSGNCCENAVFRLVSSLVRKISTLTSPSTSSFNLKRGDCSAVLKVVSAPQWRSESGSPIHSCI